MNKITTADLENLWSEVKLHQTLNHPNIIQFYDCVQTKNHLYFLLEYASNGCLFYYIHARDGVPEALGIRFLYQTALAVKLLHDKKLIHRDIKPENIVFDKNFDVKLCDFGWSCFLQDNQYRTSVCGTFEYMSPEIVRDRYHTNKVDIWCLGILLYEMLHGNPPFKGQSLEELNKEFMFNPIMINSNISPETKNLLQNLLQQNPKKRYNINQLLKHDVFQKFKNDLSRPLTSQELKLLIKIFISNSGGAQKKNLPEAVKKYLKRKKKREQKIQKQNTIETIDQKKQQKQNKDIQNQIESQKQKVFNKGLLDLKTIKKNNEPNLYNNYASVNDKNYQSFNVKTFDIKKENEQKKKINYFIEEVNRKKSEVQYYSNQNSSRNLSIPIDQSNNKIETSKYDFKKKNNYDFRQNQQQTSKKYLPFRNQILSSQKQIQTQFDLDEDKKKNIQQSYKEKDIPVKEYQKQNYDNQNLKNLKQFSQVIKKQIDNFQDQNQKYLQTSNQKYNNTQENNRRQSNQNDLKAKPQQNYINQNKKNEGRFNYSSQREINVNDLQRYAKQKQDSSILQLNLKNESKQVSNIKNYSSQRNIAITTNPFKKQNQEKTEIKNKLRNPLQFRMINSERRISQPIQKISQNLAQQKKFDSTTKETELQRKSSNVSLSDYKYALKDGKLTKIKITKEDIEFHKSTLLSNSQSSLLQKINGQQQNNDQQKTQQNKKDYSLYEDIINNNQNQEKPNKVMQKRVVSQRTISLERYNLNKLTNNQTANKNSQYSSFRNLYQSINFGNNENQNYKSKNGYSFYSKKYQYQLIIQQFLVLKETPVSSLIYLSTSFQFSSQILNLLIKFLDKPLPILKQDLNLFLPLFFQNTN